jgi:VWFA-related protein
MARGRRLSLSLFAGLVVVGARWAALRAGQEQEPTFHVTVNRVQLEAVVTDAKGQAVTDLKPEEFTVLMDGKEQRVTGCNYIRIGKTSPGAAQKAPTRPRDIAPPPVPVEELSRKEVRRTIVFLVDDGSLRPDAVLAVRLALKSVIERQVQPGDAVAVIRTVSGEGSLEQFTQDKQILMAAVDRIRWLPIGRGSPHMASDDPGAGYLSSVSFGKAERTFNMLMLRLQEMPGKKAVFLISQDWPIGTNVLSFKSSRWNEQIASFTGRCVDAAIRAGATIYTVDPTALDSLNPGADYDLWADYISRYGAGGQDPRIGPVIGSETVQSLVQDYRTRAFNLLEASRTGLRSLAEATGGLMVADSNDVAWGMTRFFDDLRGYYLIEFRPGAPEQFYAKREGYPPPFHRIQIHLKRKGLRVRYARGFIGSPANLPIAPPRAGDPIARAIASPFPASDIRLHLTALFQEPKPGMPAIDVRLSIDVRDVSFGPGVEGRHAAGLELVARTVDENGVPAQSVKKAITLQLLENTFEEAEQRGLLLQDSNPSGAPRLLSGQCGGARQRNGGNGQCAAVRGCARPEEWPFGDVRADGLPFGTGCGEPRRAGLA